ncbi:MAG: hypothetical protein ACXWLY_31355 [Thermoanaerobaculia bacterium]
MKKTCAFLVLIVTLSTATPVLAAPRDRAGNNRPSVREHLALFLKKVVRFRTNADWPVPPLPAPTPPPPSAP